MFVGLSLWAEKNMEKVQLDVGNEPTLRLAGVKGSVANIYNGAF